MNVDTPSSSFFNHESEIEEENLYLDLTNGDISEVVEDDSVDGYECEVEKFLKVVAVSGKSEAALAVPKSGPTDDILDLYADDFESSPVKKTTNTLTDPHPVVMEESHPTMQRERVKDAEVSPSVETTLNYTSNGNAEALEIEESGKGQHIATVSCKLVADIMARCASFCEELNSKNIVECKAQLPPNQDDQDSPPTFVSVNNQAFLTEVSTTATHGNKQAFLTEISSAPTSRKVRSDTRPRSATHSNKVSSTPSRRVHPDSRPRSATGSRTHKPTDNKFWPFMPSSKESNKSHASNMKVSSSAQIKTLDAFLEYLHKMSTQAQELLESADRMWKDRLIVAHTAAVQRMKAAHEKELSKFISDHLRTLPAGEVVAHSLRTHGALVGGKHMVHISDMHTDSKLSRLNSMKNKIIANHNLLEHRLQESIKLPIKKLDNLRTTMLRSIDTLNIRAKRSVQHYIRSTLAASSQIHCKVHQIRAAVAQEGAYTMIRQSLETLAQLCQKVTRYCASVDNSDKVPQHAGLSSLQKYAAQLAPANDTSLVFVSLNDFERSPTKVQASASPQPQEAQAYEEDFDNLQEMDCGPDPDNVIEYVRSIHDQYCEEEFEVDADHLAPSNALLETNQISEIQPAISNQGPHTTISKSGAEETVVRLFDDLGVDTTAYLRGIKSEHIVVKSKRKGAKTTICAQCCRPFTGPGKLVPCQRDEAKDTAAANKEKMKKEIKSELANSSSHLTVAERNRLVNMQAVLRRIPKPEKRQFCSWECVKEWIGVNAPVQFRYNTALFVDMLAGEIID